MIFCNICFPKAGVVGNFPFSIDSAERRAFRDHGRRVVILPPRAAIQVRGASKRDAGELAPSPAKGPRDDEQRTRRPVSRALRAIGLLAAKWRVLVGEIQHVECQPLSPAKGADVKRVPFFRILAGKKHRPESKKQQHLGADGTKSKSKSMGNPDIQSAENSSEKHAASADPLGALNFKRDAFEALIKPDRWIAIDQVHQ